MAGQALTPDQSLRPATPRMLNPFSGTRSIAEVHREHDFEATTLDSDPNAQNRISPRPVEYGAQCSSPPDLDDLREDARLRKFEEAKEYVSKALNPRRARRPPQSPAQP